MSNCIVCSAELKFLNTPSFGSGKLNDGTVVCTSCFKKVSKANPQVGLSLKKYSLSDIQGMLEDKQADDAQKSSKLEEIKAQISTLKLSNVSSFLGRKEINELPKILAPDEVVDNLAQGTYNKGQGILVSTNRRLLFVDKGLLYGLKVEDFPLDKISSIQYETGLLFGTIKIHTTGNIAKIDDVEKASARSFSEFIRDKLSSPKASTPAPVAAQPDVLDQLEKLAKLKESGILSEEEFAEQKKKLLEKL